MRIINQKCVRWAGVESRHAKRTSAQSVARLPKDQILRENDVLWNSTGTGTIGRACAVKKADLDEQSVVDTHVTLLRPSAVTAAWLRYWIEVPFVQEKVAGTGSTNQVELSRPMVLSMPIPIPRADVEERIISRIDALFAEIDDGEAALARARSDLETWRKALLKAAVTGELTADWRAANPPTETGADVLTRILADCRSRWQAEPRNKGKRYIEPTGPDVAALPDLPPSWTWTNVAQLTSLVTSGSRGWAEYYADEGPLFIRAQNINTDKLIVDDVAHVSPPLNSEGSRTKVNQHDILITITGANVTKSAIVSEILPESYVSQHVGLVRPSTFSVADFLYLWIITPHGGRRILEELAYGAGKPGLNLPNILGLPVPLPPLAEQAEVIRLCGSISAESWELSATSKELVEAASTLRQSILAAAFRGDLA